MTVCIIVMLISVFMFFIFIYPFIRYKTIKYINEDTRIVRNIFTGLKYKQACDHYGWFNMCVNYDNFNKKK